MYIVSPNCDPRRLPQAATQWARQFPLSPSLPNFLAELSVAPRPYKLHCPSKAHRPVYMAMLAWLMRGGWVMQLCTFAYVVVWPEIIYEVEHAQEAEDIARAERKQNMGREPGSVESDDAAIAVATPTSGVAALGDAAVAGFASGFLTLTYDPADPASSITTSLRDLSLSHSQSSIIPANSSNTSTPPPPPPPPPPHPPPKTTTQTPQPPRNKKKKPPPPKKPPKKTETQRNNAHQRSGPKRKPR
jgi:hypothetical protein